MWSRDENRPGIYKGIRFRSTLEVNVAEQLDRLEVVWLYEEPLDQAKHIRYLPDFTITLADPELDLPQWVEVKPGGLLYAVRDKARLDEKFEGVHRLAITADNLGQAGFDELAKPKALAEATGQSVLAVSAINRFRTLSILLAPDHIELSRSHPTVCRQQVLREQEYEAQRRQWEIEAEQRRIDREGQEAARLAAVLAAARANNRPARYDGWCWHCGQEQIAEMLVIFPAQDRWGACCRIHLSEVDQ